MSAGDIRLKRAYDAPANDDGTRVLVDGIWPRGVSKADAAIDEWLKDLAPSKALRQWFGHDPDKWQEFRRRYREELEDRRETFSRLQSLHEKGRVTLVFAAKNEKHNNAVVLKEALEEG